MMLAEAEALVAELHARGVELRAVGDRLRFRPKDAVPAELVENMRQRKAEIIAALIGGKTTGFGKCPGTEKCAGCYAIPGGRYMHPPKPTQNWLDWLAKWQPKEGNAIQ